MFVNGINIDVLTFLLLSKTMDNFQFPALGAGISTCRYIYNESIISLKAQYWPLCFARLCCCLGFHGSEASIVYEFYFGGKQKASEFCNITKMAAKRSLRAML